MKYLLPVLNAALNVCCVASPKSATHACVQSSFSRIFSGFKSR